VKVDRMHGHELPYRLITNVASPRALAGIGKRPHVRGMNLELTDEEAALLLKELNGIN